MIISIDGLDCSGKNTVATALQMKLSSIFKRANINANVIKISFPDYNVATGYAIKNILNGNANIPKDKIPNLFILNRLECFIENKIPMILASNKYNIIIFDRSYYSNILYQAKGKESAEIAAMAEELWFKEFEEYGIPNIDFSFFLDVPLDVIKERLEARNPVEKHDGDDVYEKMENLTAIYHLAHQLHAESILNNNNKIFPGFILNPDKYTSPNDIVDGIMSVINPAILEIISENNPVMEGTNAENIPELQPTEEVDENKEVHDSTEEEVNNDPESV